MFGFIIIDYSNAVSWRIHYTMICIDLTNFLKRVKTPKRSEWYIFLIITRASYFCSQLNTRKNVILAIVCNNKVQSQKRRGIPGNIVLYVAGEQTTTHHIHNDRKPQNICVHINIVFSRFIRKHLTKSRRLLKKYMCQYYILV